MSRARSWRSRIVWRSTSNQRTLSPDVDEGDEQQDDEGDQLAEHEDAVGSLEDHPDRVEEDDLDVEEDEEHRDQVEADPEAQPVARARPGSPTRTARPGGGWPRSACFGRFGPIRWLSIDEGAADGGAEEGEDEDRQVALQHWLSGARPAPAPPSLLYTHLVTHCYIVIFRISKPNPDPFGRI